MIDDDEKEEVLMEFVELIQIMMNVRMKNRGRREVAFDLEWGVAGTFGEVAEARKEQHAVPTQPHANMQLHLL